MSFLGGLFGAIGGAVSGIVTGNPLAAVSGAVRGAVKGAKGKNGGLRFDVPKVAGGIAGIIAAKKGKLTAPALGMAIANAANLPVLKAAPPAVAGVLPQFVSSGGGAGGGPVNTFAPPALTGGKNGTGSKAYRISKQKGAKTRKRRKRAARYAYAKPGARSRRVAERQARRLSRAQLDAGFGGRRRMRASRRRGGSS